MTEQATRSGLGGAGVALVFLGGAMAGALTALLLAPGTGRETRQRIAEAVERSGDAARRTRLAAGEAIRAAREAFGEAAAREEH